MISNTRDGLPDSTRANDDSTPARSWGFLTNHAHVLLCVAQDANVRLRDIAAAVGITERAAHRILTELVKEGYVIREKEGRRNRYSVVPALPLRNPLVQERAVGELLELLIAHSGTNR